MEDMSRIRKVLHPEKRGEPIARELKNLRRGDVADTDYISTSTEADMKTEVYAIAAYVIERVHPETVRKVDEEERRNPEGRISARTPSEVFRFIRGIERLYPEAFEASLKEWLKDAQDEPGNENRRVLDRMEKLLLGSHYGMRDKSYPHGSIETFILRGAYSAADASWGALCAIPIAYFSRYGRILSPEEFREIAKRAEPLLVKIASMHIDSFVAAREHAEHEARRTYGSTEFPSEFFAFEEVGGRPQLVLNPTLVDELDRTMQRRGGETGEPRLGCPARDARVTSDGGRQESVLSAVHKIYMGLAEKYLIPNLDVYVNGAHAESRRLN